MSLKLVAKELAARCGVAALCRRRTGNRARILMYHRFPQNSLERLARQCEHLRRNYDVRPLSEIAAGAGKPTAGRPLAITVDDGYVDFDGAWQVFHSYGIPVTFFITSGFVDRELWLWPDVVKFVVAHSSQREVTIGSVRYSLEEADRRLSGASIAQHLIGLQNDERLELLRDFPERFGVTLPTQPPTEDSPIAWDRLRAMSREGLDVGAHTRTHPVLSRLPNRDAVVEEIGGSQDRIAAQIGSPVNNFCYPNGQTADYDDTARSVVRELGMNAVNAMRGLISANADPVDLCRIGVDPWLDMGTFQLETAGYRM